MQHVHQTISPQVHKRFEVNITPLERMGRVFIGIVGVVSGISLLLSTSGILATVLTGLLILAGLDMIVTGATGFCPLYKKLGRPSLSERETVSNHEHC